MTKQINSVFDSLLQRQKIVQNTDVSSVHNWMDNYLKLRTWQVREAEIDIKEVKLWILGESNQRNPEVFIN